MSDPRLEQIRATQAKAGNTPETEVAYLLALIDTLQRERDEAVRKQNLNAVAGVNVGEMLRATEAQVSRLTEALRRVEYANEHHGAGPHCTCSQSERERIISDALHFALAVPPQEPQPG